MSQPDLDWDLRSGAADAVPPDRDLRAELADAIEIQRKRDHAAERAAGISEIAETLKAEAAAEVARLQAEQRDAERFMIERRAKAITEALRAGSDLPAPSIPSPADTAALTQATAAHNALELAAGKLAAERDAARAEAAAAAQTVSTLVYAIGMTNEAHDLKAEVFADLDRFWKSFDRLAALVRLDEGRSGGPTLRALQEEVVQRTGFERRSFGGYLYVGINRRKALVARNPLFIEQHNVDQHLDDILVAEERLRREYLLRLAADAKAAFDD